MYSQVISLGFFCSVALELQRIDLRSKSSPFDWVISDLGGVMELIKNHFKDYLNPGYLIQDPDYPYIFTNQRYGISFYHDFIPGVSIKDQISAVQFKYLNRINHFYMDIVQPTLFIRYIKDQAEYDLLCINYQTIMYELKKFNANNELILIGNSDLLEKPSVLTKNIYKVEKDAGDEVARQFLDKNIELMQLLRGPVIPEYKRLINKKWRNHTKIGD